MLSFGNGAKNGELDWYLLAEKEHLAIQNWVRDLLHLYKQNKALYEMDQDWRGFESMNADDGYRSIFSFVRHFEDGKKNLLFVCNFTPMERADYPCRCAEEKAV